MQRTVSISILQSLVAEHKSPIYQEALDCIKNELAEKLKPSHNKQGTSCEHMHTHSGGFAKPDICDDCGEEV